MTPAAFKERAAQEDRSLANLIRRALGRYIETGGDR